MPYKMFFRRFGHLKNFQLEADDYDLQEDEDEFVWFYFNIQKAIISIIKFYRINVVDKKCWNNIFTKYKNVLNNGSEFIILINYRTINYNI